MAYDVKFRSQSDPVEGKEGDPDASGSANERATTPSIGAPGAPTSLRQALPDLPIGKEDMPELMSAKVALNEPAGKQIEIRGPTGSIVGLRDLPTGLDAPNGMADGDVAHDSMGPMRRDSMGMRVLVKDSWAPDAMKRRKSASNLRDMARSVASWVLLLALSVDLLALVLEPLYLLRAGAPLRPAIASGIAAAGLSVFFATAAAVPVAGVHGLVRFLGRMKSPWRYLWPLPLLTMGWTIVSNIAPHRVIHSLPVATGQLILAALFSIALVVATGITRIRRARVRIALGLSITAFAFILNMMMPAVLSREPRDLLWLCGVFCFAAVFYPMRRQLVTMPHERVSRAFGALLLVSTVCIFVAPLISGDWRTWASNGGRFAPRLARFCRMLVDLDGDGFSAIAWGADCDDFDVTRAPEMPERLDGIDHNCNGKARPAVSTPAQRGLAPAAGEPDAAPGEIDRVVLVTIDCFRNDAFNPTITPNLAKLATRGIRFEKLYSSGARTAMSLPFLLRGAINEPTVAEILGPERVSTTALFGYRHSTLEGNVFDGFQVINRPDAVDHRIRAPDLTNLALADVREPAHAQSHFLWVHYFDAHGPRTRRVLPPDVPSFPPMSGETDDDSALYLSELNFIDREVGRLIDGLDQIDGLKRTVLIVTNDHGEGFGRHGVFEHGVSAFEAIIHSPGILVAPGVVPGTYAHVAAQRDIAATVLGSFGLVAKHPKIETFARSWLRLRAAPAAPLHEFAFSYETTTPFERWGDAPMASIVDDRAKFSVSYVDGITRFYHLDEDPAEDHELTFARPAEVARYRDEIELYRDIDQPPP